MAQALSIDGKEYVSAVSAGKHFGYTKDYLLLLIKQGKIDGQKVGNRWYVHMPSAEYFFTLAKREREVRRKHLSLTRKQELKKISSAQKVEVEDNASEDFISDAHTAHKHTALVETLVVVALGLAVGAMGFLGASTSQYATAHQGVGGFFESLSRALYGAVSPNDEQVDTQHAAVTASGETAPALSETEAGTARSVVVLPMESSSADVAAIKDSFSDPVTVVTDPADPDTGIITPKFRDGKGKSYRFLMVPVTEHESGTLDEGRSQS